MRVVYGHTDSIYVQMPIEKTEETLSILNNHVRKKFPNVLGLDQHPVSLEFEKYFQSLGVGITKNRNAGLISWKDGAELKEPEFVMTGFAAKRVTITELAKRIQMEVLMMWVNGEPEAVVTKHLKTQYNAVLSGKTELKSLTNRSRYRPERFTYMCADCSKLYTATELVEYRKSTISYSYCQKCGSGFKLLTQAGKKPMIGEGIEGVLWWNQTQNNPIDDSYIYIRVEDEINRPFYINPVTGVRKRPSYISAPSIAEFPEVKPDFKHYAESIIKKAEPIYKAMGWSTDEIKKDINQQTLNDWW